MDGAERITIVGTGAMACLFAYRLAPYSEISMLGTWEQGLQSIASDGVRLISSENRSIRVGVTSDPHECEGSSHVLFLVKSWQTKRAAQQVASFLPEEGIALTLQNGLGNYEILSSVLGEERTAQGITTMGATLEGPGTVRLGGEGITSLASHPRIGPWIQVFERADLEVELSQNLPSLIWGKLVINTGINPLTALLEVANGDLLESESSRAIMAGAVEETVAVAKANEIDLPFTDPIAKVEEVARKTASNISSMLQDIRRGAPTEIDSMSGAVVREGERLGIPTPINWLLRELISAKVSLTRMR